LKQEALLNKRSLKGEFMRKFLSAAILILLIGTLSSTLAQGVGNPIPGVPHDTVVFHVQKAENGAKGCAGSVGGHALFLRAYNGAVPQTFIYITMIDWVQADNDGDGRSDEDKPGDTNGDGNPDDDLDGKIDEDGVEPGTETVVLDCDAYGDYKVALQIRDTDPRKDWVSVQRWFLRLIGPPKQNFAFTSYANQTVVCTINDPTPESPNSGDETASCTTGTSNTTTDWVELTQFNAEVGGCVKQVKGSGGGGTKAGGKTKFCDVTDGFEVDVDRDGDGAIDADGFDQWIFGVRVGCLDNLETTTVDESLSCPLSSIVWGTDEDTTSRAKAQIFVSHVGSVNVRTGQIR
jgi:hypothetical protein